MTSFITNGFYSCLCCRRPIPLPFKTKNWLLRAKHSRRDSKIWFLASQEDANTGDSSQEVHPSWKIYEEPGNKCVVCLGRGKVKCLYCFGEGKVRIGPDDEDTIVCNQCFGEKFTTCMRCEGSGVRPSVIYDFETNQWVPGPTNVDIVARVKEKQKHMNQE
eukprot:jgi/Galph1/5398/GphlegSOOS_G4074.1